MNTSSLQTVPTICLLVQNCSSLVSCKWHKASCEIELMTLADMVNSCSLVIRANRFKQCFGDASQKSNLQWGFDMAMVVAAATAVVVVLVICSIAPLYHGFAPNTQTHNRYWPVNCCTFWKLYQNSVNIFQISNRDWTTCDRTYFTCDRLGEEQT